MSSRQDLERQTMMAARDNGISSVLFRNSIGRKLGLNVTDSECLSFLAIKGSATPKELSRYTGLTTGSTTAMLDRLEKALFVSRKPNPTDRRGVIVEIGQKWFDLAGPLVADVQKAHSLLLDRYSDQELQVITDFLTRFTQNVQTQTKKIQNT